VILALAGPSASGKTAIALELAERFGAEIVCADSMTVYRGMDVGTAKPSAAERARVAHHLLDVADPGEPFSVARYQRLAREVIARIRDNGRVPFVVGGSGLYFRAAADDLEFPPADPKIRARIEREDLGVLAVRLKEADPEAAAFVDPANKRRVVRALEVIEITGRPFSSFRDAWGRYGEVVVAGLDVPRDVLERRVEARLRGMLAAGLLDEVRALLASGFRDAVTARRAIGYAEAVAVIDGEIGEDELVRRATRATLKLARRQMSWFRRDPRVVWFDATELRRAAAQVGAYYDGHVPSRSEG
jgi:tRNA dimethylallyltransferase